MGQDHAEGILVLIEILARLRDDLFALWLGGVLAFPALTLLGTALSRRKRAKHERAARHLAPAASEPVARAAADARVHGLAAAEGYPIAKPDDVVRAVGEQLGAYAKVARTSRDRAIVEIARTPSSSVACDAPACHYERALLEGLFAQIARHGVSVVETRCRATGALRCTFEVTFLRPRSRWRAAIARVLLRRGDRSSA